MEKQKVLILYSFTNYDKKSLDFVVRTFAENKNVEITLFNAYIPLPKLDLKESTVMEKLKGNLNYLSSKIHDQEQGLKSVKHQLVLSGFSDDQVGYIFKEKEKDMALELKDVIEEGGYSVLVLSRQAGKVSRLFVQGIHDKILSSAKDVTICIAT